jgi:RNA polymerase sigma factor FliA
MAGRAPDPLEPYRPPAERAAADPPACAPGDAAAIARPDPREAGRDDEAALWRRSVREEDPAARALLAERYMPYARAIAGRLYARRPHREIEFDEYEQFAMVGLMEAVQRYLPDRGAKFTTYAMPRIQGAILNGLQQLSERQQQLAFRRRVAAERVESLTPEALSKDPTRQLLAQLQEIGVGMALGFLLEGTGMVLGGTEAVSEDPYASLELRRLHDQLWEMTERLTEREREILHMHYRKGIQFEEIARTLRLTKGRISQLHKQAVLRLRELVSKAESCDVAY